jgi:hypothetical protein
MAMQHFNLILAALMLAALAPAQDPAQDGPVDLQAVGADKTAAAEAAALETAVRADDGRGTPYIVNRADSICGIAEPRAITSPAKVDYDELLGATPEVRLIKRRRIDPESAKGIKLMTEARRKVLAACETVRASEGYCSIWKGIKRRDKTPVDDITAKVKAQIADDDEPADS